MPARHTQLAAWLDIPERDTGVDLGTLKKSLASHGVNARGWRLYLDFGDVLFDFLGRPWLDMDWPFSSGPNAVGYLKLLAACEMDVPPPWELVSSMNRWTIPGNRLDAVPPLFFRALWKHCIAASYEDPDRHLAPWVLDTIVPMAQWYFTTGQHRSPDANLLKAGWPALDRHHQEWTSERVQVADVPEWPVLVRAVEYDGLRFVALLSVAALREEGVAMKHCIADYDDVCQETSLRAYSARYRKTGARVATLTVAYVSERGCWTLDQIHGLQNAEVDQRTARAATALLQSLDEATAADISFKTFLSGLQMKPRRVDVEDDCCPPF